MKTTPIRIPFYSLQALPGCPHTLTIHHHEPVRIDRLVFTCSAPNAVRVKDWIVGRNYTSLVPEGAHTADDRERRYIVRRSVVDAKESGGEVAYSGMTMQAFIVNDSPVTAVVEGYAEGVTISDKLADKLPHFQEGK